MIYRSAGNEIARKIEKTNRSYCEACLKIERDSHTWQASIILLERVVLGNGASSPNILSSNRNHSVSISVLNSTFIDQCHSILRTGARMCTAAEDCLAVVKHRVLAPLNQFWSVPIFSKLRSTLKNALRTVRLLLYKQIGCTIYLYFLSQPPVLKASFHFRERSGLHRKLEKNLSLCRAIFSGPPSLVVEP